MNITVKFTDVYGGEEHERTEEIAVKRPVTLAGEAFDEWALDEIFEHTGDGTLVRGRANADLASDLAAYPVG